MEERSYLDLLDALGHCKEGSEEEFERFANQMAMLRAIEILDKVGDDRDVYITKN